MRRGDELVERAAEKLERFAQKVAADGGPMAALAEPLAEDAAFLRKLKPTLIRARARGEAPTDEDPGTTEVIAPSGPQLGSRPRANGGGPNPFVIVGAAFALGVVLAKAIDWRSHAHPRW